MVTRVRVFLLGSVACGAVALAGCGGSSESDSSSSASTCPHSLNVSGSYKESLAANNRNTAIAQVDTQMCIVADFSNNAFVMAGCKVGTYVGADVKGQASQAYKLGQDDQASIVVNHDGDVGITYNGDDGCQQRIVAGLKRLK